MVTPTTSPSGILLKSGASACGARAARGGVCSERADVPQASVHVACQACVRAPPAHLKHESVLPRGHRPDIHRVQHLRQLAPSRGRQWEGGRCRALPLRGSARPALGLLRTWSYFSDSADPTYVSFHSRSARARARGRRSEWGDGLRDRHRTAGCRAPPPVSAPHSLQRQPARSTAPPPPRAHRLPGRRGTRTGSQTAAGWTPCWGCPAR